jgi:hypothetical protein
LAASSVLNTLIPVRFPAGPLRLATKPSADEVIE